MLIVIVMIGVIGTLVITHYADSLESAYVAAMKNDLHNFAIVQEQQLHSDKNSYGSLADVLETGEYGFSPLVSLDYEEYTNRHWFMRVQHEKTNTRCSLLMSSSEDIAALIAQQGGDRDQVIQNRIVCHGENWGFGLHEGPIASFEYVMNEENRQEVTYTAIQNPFVGPVEYTWFFPDGTVLQGETVTHERPCTHNYSPSWDMQFCWDEVELEVREIETNEIRTTTGTVTINKPPTVPCPGGLCITQDGATVTFDASGSHDPDGDPLDVVLETGDGTAFHGFIPGTDGEGQLDAVWTHTYGAAGVYLATLTVTDPYGAYGTAAREIIIGHENAAPEPILEISGDLTAGSPITFDASGSYDPDGDPITCLIRFGDDNQQATCGSVQHIYQWAGVYPVRLTVSDDRGGSKSVTEHLSVGGASSPTASFTGPTTAVSGEEVTFDGSASSSPNGNIVLYEWHFGDGTKMSGPVASHSFGPTGRYSVGLMIEDEHGFRSWRNRFIRITGANQPPTASFTMTPSEAREGQVVELDGSASVDPDGDALAFTWTFPDGTTSTGVHAQWTAQCVGCSDPFEVFLGEVTLTVEDPHGLSDSVSHPLSVELFPLALDVYSQWNEWHQSQWVSLGVMPMSSEHAIVDASVSWDAPSFSSGNQWFHTNVHADPSGSGINAHTSYVAAGIYDISISATTSSGATHTLSTADYPELRIVVPAPDLTLEMYGPGYDVHEGTQASLQVNYNDRPIVGTPSWDFGSASSTFVIDEQVEYPGSASLVTLRYLTAGSRTITASGLDEAGRTWAGQVQVDVIPSVVHLQGSAGIWWYSDDFSQHEEGAYDGTSISVPAGVPGFFDLSLSVDLDGCVDSFWEGEESSALSETWNWGDGSAPVTINSAQWSWDGGDYPQHTYAAPGTYSASVTYTNNCGRTATWPLTVVAVDNVQDDPEFGLSYPAAVTLSGDIRLGGGAQQVLSGGSAPGLIRNTGSQRQNVGGGVSVTGSPSAEVLTNVTSQGMLTFGDYTWAQLVDLATNNLAGQPYTDEAFPATSSNSITYIAGSATFQPGISGQGILLVDGDLAVQGGLTWNGLIVVNGNFTHSGPSPTVISGSLQINNEFDQAILAGDIQIHYVP